MHAQLEDLSLPTTTPLLPPPPTSPPTTPDWLPAIAAHSSVENVVANENVTGDGNITVDSVIYFESQGEAERFTALLQSDAQSVFTLQSWASYGNVTAEEVVMEEIQVNQLAHPSPPPKAPSESPVSPEAAPAEEHSEDDEGGLSYFDPVLFSIMIACIFLGAVLILLFTWRVEGGRDGRDRVSDLQLHAEWLKVCSAA
ncbi:hypothetical protein CYMTET_16590 [Cymbomonas tetramitiformis]|uniref:Uncharacterized protein n=1 Tax=Cymbomonas tetramitiformis TaxID=36881 RepID=A0AAE0L7V2_9CHLO|nr:hypothetical protein CYMTET_16590 [Cymbomonas tetramitiformis]